VDAPLWQPSPARAERTLLTAFMRGLEAREGIALPDYAALHRWSIESPAAFWSEVWRFAGVIGDGPGPALAPGDTRMPGADWFPEARLNFAENLLRRRDARPAIAFHGEDRVRRHLTWDQLYVQIERLAGALRAWGIARGDRVAGLLPNLPEAVVAMLAATSIGAVWSSTSPDFGVDGVVD